MRRWSDYPRSYFNQAGSGPCQPAVRRRVREVDDLLASVGAHSPAGLGLLDELLGQARAALARGLGAPADWQASFAGSATDGLNLVAAAVVPRRRCLVVSDEEHPSGVLAAVVQGGRGFALDVLPTEPRATLGERAAAARRRADALLLSHVSYRTGLRLPVEALPPPEADDGLLVLDVSHAVGQVNLAAVWERTDVVVGLGHKWLHGPLPSGFLLASPRAWERLAVPRGGWHARVESDPSGAVTWRSGGERLEPGSMDLARVAGLQRSLDSLPSLLGRPSRARVDRYRAQVVEVLGRLGCEPIPGARDGIVSLPVRRSARWVAAELLALGVVVRDLNPPECPDLIRISLCPLHEPGEVDRLCGALERVLRRG